MKSSILCVLIVVAFISCKKNPVDPAGNKPAAQKNFKDSCTYTIDGKQFFCNTPVSHGRGNYGASLDTTNNLLKWHPDTSLYVVSYGLAKNSLPKVESDGWINIHFVKKFGKNQLVKPLPGILAPVTDTLLYKKGFHTFSTDFERFNNENGVAMKVAYRNGGISQVLYSYILKPHNVVSTLNSQSQNDASFEVTAIHVVPNGGYFIEAKFSINLFDADEKPKRLENGYISMYVD